MGIFCRYIINNITNQDLDFAGTQSIDTVNSETFRENFIFFANIV